MLFKVHCRIPRLFHRLGGWVFGKFESVCGQLSILPHFFFLAAHQKNCCRSPSPPPSFGLPHIKVGYSPKGGEKGGDADEADPPPLRCTRKSCYILFLSPGQNDDYTDKAFPHHEKKKKEVCGIRRQKFDGGFLYQKNLRRTPGHC